MFAIKNLPSKADVLKAIKNTRYDLANKYLYQMCRENFTHQRTDQILAKTILIGRVYAAALERRKNKFNMTNEEFYLKEVIPVFKKPFLDRQLLRLKKLQLEEGNLKEFLKLHYILMKHLNGITELNKRSFVSKYLHFHLENKFFIFDSRAEEALRRFDIKLRKVDMLAFSSEEVDDRYTKFFLKSFALRKAINKEYKINLSPRQLDNLYLYTHSNST